MERLFSAGHSVVDTSLISLILPTFATRHWWERLLHNRDVTRLRGALRQHDGVNVISFTYDLALQKPAS